MRIEVDCGGPKVHAMFIGIQPVSAKRTKIYFFFCRNFDLDTPDEQLIDWEVKILSEDKPIVENQRPEEIPLDLAEEYHSRADMMSLRYRRELIGLGLGRPLVS